MLAERSRSVVTVLALAGPATVPTKIAGDSAGSGVGWGRHRLNIQQRIRVAQARGAQQRQTGFGIQQRDLEGICRASGVRMSGQAAGIYRERQRPVAG